MPVETISDVLSRINAIEQQFQQLQGGAMPAASATSGGAAIGSATGAGAASATSFANELAQAQQAQQPQQAASVSLPASASAALTSGQQQFASTLAADTGLNPGVVTAWLLAEESGSAAQSRQAAGNNDWLNVGYTDSGTYGAGDAVWSDPVSAANATAAWLKGQSSISGYGTASTGIQAILSSAGQPPAAQIQTIQSSGWSSGGYPSLPSIYASVSGG
jgi:hypothetical protein